MSHKPRYSQLSEHDKPLLNLDSKDFDDQDDTKSPPSRSFRHPRSSTWTLVVVIVNILVFVCSASMALWSYQSLSTGRIRNHALRQTNNFSPLMDDIDLPLRTVKIDGMLLDVTHSIYLQDPSPDVDEAWEALAKNDFIHLTGADIMKMGQNPEVCAKLPEEWGYGSDAYAGEMDIVHKIHCLDALRKEIHFDHYYGYKYSNRSEISEGHRMHANHCLNILLQTLTCDANTDIVPFVWVQGQTHPFPNFSIKRKCGSYDAIKDWKEHHTIDRARFTAWRKPEDEKHLKLLPELRRIFDQDDSHSEHHDQ